MPECIQCGKTLVNGKDGVLRCAECWKARLNETKANLPPCKWNFDRAYGIGCNTIWKTECGREFDRLQGSEQPRKHLAMEFCPFCGGSIVDMTQDC